MLGAPESVAVAGRARRQRLLEQRRSEGASAFLEGERLSAGFGRAAGRSFADDSSRSVESTRLFRHTIPRATALRLSRSISRGYASAVSAATINEARNRR